MMTPAVDNALSARVVTVADLVKIEFPDYTLRLCSGSAEVMFAGELYVGRDARFGSMALVQGAEESLSDSAPALQLTLLPPSISAAIELSNAAMQGSLAQFWLAAVDPLTGTVIPDPIDLFAGEIDVPRLRGQGGVLQAVYQIVSGAERFFDNEEGMRLSDSHHQSIWPNELGLSHITGVARQDIWGPGDTPPAARVISPPPPTGVRRTF